MKNVHSICRAPVCIILLSMIGLLASCGGGSALRYEKLSASTGKNDFLSAISAIQKNYKKWYGKTNEYLYTMDVGMLFHYAGTFDSSTVYLQRAAALYDGLFSRSVSNEAASLLINDNVRPYRSRPYELVLAHGVNSLNYMAMNNNEGALVESRAVQLLFNEWERKDRHGQKYSGDAMMHYLSSIWYDAAGSYDDAMISLFKSVETFKKGPLELPTPIQNYAYYMFLHNGRDQDTGLLKIAAGVPKEIIPGINNKESEIILVGYAGKGPLLMEDNYSGTYIRGGLLHMSHVGENGAIESFTMGAPPLPEKEYNKASRGEKTNLGTTFHIRFSLPKIRTFPSATSYFSLAGPQFKSSEKSVIINDLDKQLAKNLEDTRAATIMRTVIRTTLRTISAQKAKSEMKTSSPIANALIGIGTDVLADQLEKADTRCCFLIPKTVQIARMPVAPGTYSFEAYAHSKEGSTIDKKSFENIVVKKGEKRVVFFSSFR